MCRSVKKKKSILDLNLSEKFVWVKIMGKKFIMKYEAIDGLLGKSSERKQKEERNSPLLHSHDEEIKLISKKKILARLDLRLTTSLTHSLTTSLNDMMENRILPFREKNRQRDAMF